MNHESRITNHGLRVTNHGLRVTNYESRITDYGLRITNQGLRITNYELRITNYGLRFTFCVLLWLLVGCKTQSDVQRAALAAWLEARALPSERVAAPEMLARRLGDHSAIALPEDSDTAALLATLRAEPDYVVAWSGVAWDGAQAQPWFQAHYRFLDTLPFSGSSLTPLRIYGYTPSPFDHGVWQPVQQSLGGTGFELRAVRVNRQRLTPGVPLYVTLFWGGDLFALPDAQRLALRLLDVESGRGYAGMEQSMDDGLPPDLFRDGDDVLSQHTLAVPGDLPYGDYILALTLYRRNGAPVGAENLALATLHYPPAVTNAPPAPEIAGTWYLGDAVALIGYEAVERVSPGDHLQVTLYWHARTAVSGDYKVFIHLLDANGAVASQDDSAPVNWTYPTSQWKPGQYIRDAHVLKVDNHTPRGDYTLFVGMYDPETNVRLVVTDALGVTVPDEHIELRVVKVR